jgi:hypothetical protein
MASIILLYSKLPDTKRLQQIADWLAVGVAVSLPLSTSATAVLIVLWLLAVIPTFDVSLLRREFASFAGGLPVMLWMVAAFGMLWADVPWSYRFYGLGAYHRLLVIPLLLAHFRRSNFGPVVCCGFLLSATCVLALSWLFALVPAWATLHLPRIGNHITAFGVPVKDYVWQSGIFLICGLALVGAAWEHWRTGQRFIAVALVGLAAGFLADNAFVVTSRTAVMVAPVLIAALGYLLLGWRGVLAAGLVAVVLAGGAWATSPYLRARIDHSFTEFRAYRNSDAANSTGLHLQYLRESIGIIREAPLIGHGTGSIIEEFREAAAGRAGTASAVATVNPHNQIFGVAIELGALGTAVLMAMWAAHILLFGRGGVMAWVGMLIVLENVSSSLFNSHLFDFTQGWLYVFGVGVCGGTVLRQAAVAPNVGGPDAIGAVRAD